MSFRRLLNALLASLLLCGTGMASRAAERVNVAEPRRTYRLRVVLFDFKDGHESMVPNHRSWQTADWLSSAFFAAGLSAVDSSGQRQAYGSAADYIRRELPNVTLTGEIYPFPASAPTVDGWYQFSSAPGDRFRPETPLDDAGWAAFYATLLARLGITDADLFSGGYNGVMYLHGGGGGQVFGGVHANVGLGNFATPQIDRVPRYDWLGVVQHEVVHMVAGLSDFYGNVWAGDSYWEVLSFGELDGNGQFPSPISGWVRYLMGYTHERYEYGKGESTSAFFPTPTATQPRRIAVLENSTAGNADRLVVEYRERDSTDSRGWFDTTGAGMPGDNDRGLLIADLDTHAQGTFFSSGNENGAPPSGFALPRDALEGPIDNVYGVTPIVGWKHQDGDIDSQQDLYGSGQDFLAEYPADAFENLFKSSANRDGDVIWEFRNPQPGGGGMWFDIEFQGRPLAAAAAADGVQWTSSAGVMNRGSLASRAGWYFEQGGEYRPYPTSGRTYRDNLWLFTNRRGTAATYSMEATVPHSIDVNGEQLSAAVAFENPTGTQSVRLTLEVESGGTRTSVLDATFNSSYSASHSDPPEFVADLTRWCGRSVALHIRATASEETGIGLLGAFFFRKGQRPFHDFVDRAADARPLTYGLSPKTPVADPAGAFGPLGSVQMQDGVTYGRAIAMKPAGTPHGIMHVTWPPVSVPPEGAILRGRMGFLPGSAGLSDGVSLRITLDDFVHRLPVRDWTPPLLVQGDTFVALNLGSGLGASRKWGSGLGWIQGHHAQWDQAPGLYWRGGDWMRTGDFNGDGRDDIVVFTGGDHPRAGVALSTGSGFGPLRSWHEWFALTGERPFVGRFNQDALSDIVTFTDAGEAFVAHSTGTGFVGTATRWGAGLAAADEPVAIADADGDGLDDVLIFHKFAHPTPAGPDPRPAGSVWVARSTGSSFTAPSRWAQSLCAGPNVPVVGDLDGDRRADIAIIGTNGSVSVALSTGLGFTAATTWLASGGPLNRGGPSFVGHAPYPGPHFIDGAVPFITHSGTNHYLAWFNRSSPATRTNNPSGTSNTGNIFVARALPSHSFDPPSRWSTSFGLNEDWPLVGDFDGDGRFDVATTQPTYANVQTWYARFLDDPATSERFPGDLYLSPRRDDLTFLGRLGGTNIARVNRMEMDVSAFAGRNLSLDVAVEAGPDAEGDLVVWPDLKLYRRTSMPRVHAHADPSSGSLSLSWSGTDANVVVQESPLSVPFQWSNVAVKPVASNGVFRVQLPVRIKGGTFFRLVQP